MEFEVAVRSANLSFEEKMADIDVRKGMPSSKLDRKEFDTRFRSRFKDPAFEPLEAEISALAAVAWDGYANGRKAPRTEKAGLGFADPDYDLSVDWIKARDDIVLAQTRYDDPNTKQRILLINGSSRSDQTCPGEMSKSYRLAMMAEPVLQQEGYEVDFLDLSRLTSEMGRQIHPCKSCVSTAMPLCHWPCSCYPNYSLEQTNDWMNEIYPLWVGAHGVMIITPVNWYQAPTGLKAMIDRLVCADGGNPDPSSTHGKKPAEAKAIELNGWDYPKHLSGRLFSIVVHGDSIGVETLRRSLSDWLTDIEMISAGALAEKGGYIGYEEPYATSHQSLDKDEAFQQDVRSAALTLARAIKLQNERRLEQPDKGLRSAKLK